jgi:DNA helicase-2/ATP-dependent DNA helicase PcrA
MALSRDYPKIKTIKLLTNYRSTQNILDAAYGVIANNQLHPILELKTNNDPGEKIRVFEAYSEKDEATFIADKIKSSQSEVAVLYRTNAQSRALEEEFLRRGIAYTLVGGVKFYERREVKDLLAYLRVIANPLDQVSWERLDKVGKRRRAAFELWLKELLDQQPDLSKIHTPDLLTGILNATNYLSLYDEHDENDLMRLENIKELASVASEFTDLTAFLENVSLVQSEMTANLDQSDNKVTLMTMHAAKGLEFEIVFVAGMEENLFPHSRSLMDREQMEEERRLCYVAITRAKRELYLTFARQRLYFGQRQQGTPSRFLSEIPEKLLSGASTQLEPSHTGRRLVQDWEVDQVTADDFAEIDSW